MTHAQAALPSSALGWIASAFAKRQRVYGVGAAKTGTHSLARLFAQRVRAVHEADAETLISLHLSRVASGNNNTLRHALHQRDRQARLHIDASQVNIYLIDDLEALFQDCRYVLTVRAPHAWLRSIVDDSLRRTTSDTWMRFRAYRFGGKEPTRFDGPLTDRGLFPLSGYLGYWADSIDRAMTRIDDNRLFIVKTEQIGARAQDLAAFCRVNSATPDTRPAFVNRTRFGVVDEIDPDYLASTINTQCSPLIAKLADRGVVFSDPLA